MSFLVFEQVVGEDGVEVLKPTGHHFKLAGSDNLLKRAWLRRGKPFNQGWHVTQTELVDLHFGSSERPRLPRLLFDFHPSAKGRIGIVEPKDIYAYTCAEDGEVAWTPLMLRVVDVFYKLYDTPLTDESRNDIVSRIPLDYPPKEAVEFLYLQGDNGNWNWGRTGGVNAAFIQNEARDYFRQFF